MRMKPSRIALQIIVVLLACIIIIPFLMICINSLKDVREAALFKLSLPSKWMWNNYKAVATQAHVLRGFRNSLILCFFTVLLDALIASMAAFAIQRRKGRSVRGFYYLFILGLIVPVSIIPTIKLMMDLHIHNT